MASVPRRKKSISERLGSMFGSKLMAESYSEFIDVYLEHEKDKDLDRWVARALVPKLEQEIAMADEEEGRIELARKVIFLASMGHDTDFACQNILDLLASANPSARRVAYQALGIVFAGGSKAEMSKAMIPLMQDIAGADAEMAEVAVTAMASFATKSLGEALVSKLASVLASSDDPAVRMRVALLLGRLWAQSNSKREKKILPALLTAVTDNDEAVVGAVLTVLEALARDVGTDAALGPVVSVVTRLVSHHTAPVTLCVALRTAERLMISDSQQHVKAFKFPVTQVAATCESIVLLPLLSRIVFTYYITEDKFMMQEQVERACSAVENGCTATEQSIGLAVLIDQLKARAEPVVQLLHARTGGCDFLFQRLDSREITIRWRALNALNAAVDDYQAEKLVNKLASYLHGDQDSAVVHFALFGLLKLSKAFVALIQQHRGQIKLMQSKFKNASVQTCATDLLQQLDASSSAGGGGSGTSPIARATVDRSASGKSFGTTSTGSGSGSDMHGGGARRFSRPTLGGSSSGTTMRLTDEDLDAMAVEMEIDGGADGRVAAAFEAGRRVLDRVDNMLSAVKAAEAGSKRVAEQVSSLRRVAQRREEEAKSLRVRAEELADIIAATTQMAIAAPEAQKVPRTENGDVDMPELVSMALGLRNVVENLLKTREAEERRRENTVKQLTQKLRSTESNLEAQMNVIALRDRKINELKDALVAKEKDTRSSPRIGGRGSDAKELQQKRFEVNTLVQSVRVSTAMLKGKTVDPRQKIGPNDVDVDFEGKALVEMVKLSQKRTATDARRAQEVQHELMDQLKRMQAKLKDRDSQLAEAQAKRSESGRGGATASAARADEQRVLLAQRVRAYHSELKLPPVEGNLDKWSDGAWETRWFSLRGRNLFYYRMQEAHPLAETVRLLSIREVAPIPESSPLGLTAEQKARAFSVTVASSSGTDRKHFMMADSRDIMHTWVQMIIKSWQLYRAIESSPDLTMPIDSLLNMVPLPRPVLSPTASDSGHAASPRMRTDARPGSPTSSPHASPRPASRPASVRSPPTSPRALHSSSSASQIAATAPARQGSVTSSAMHRVASASSGLPRSASASSVTGSAAASSMTEKLLSPRGMQRTSSVNRMVRQASGAASPRSERVRSMREERRG